MEILEFGTVNGVAVDLANLQEAELVTEQTMVLPPRHLRCGLIATKHT